jgi:hypothetical protein
VSEEEDEEEEEKRKNKVPINVKGLLTEVYSIIYKVTLTVLL